MLCVHDGRSSPGSLWTDQFGFSSNTQLRVKITLKQVFLHFSWKLDSCIYENTQYVLLPMKKKNSQIQLQSELLKELLILQIM